MADGETVRFSCLNDSNYAEWAVHMQAILVRCGLWSQIINIVVDETGKDATTIAAEVEDLKKKRNAVKMDEACAEMVLRVEDSQLSHMHSGDLMEVWQTLHHVHLAAGFATSLTLHRKFLTAKKSTAQSMQAWIGHIKSLVFCMEEAGVEVASELLTLNHVIACLLNEEARQSSHSATTNEEDGHDEVLAAVQKNRSHPCATGRNTSTDIICYFCDEKGHYKSECPARREWEKAKAKKIKGVAAAAWDSESDSDISFIVYCSSCAYLCYVCGGVLEYQTCTRQYFIDLIYFYDIPYHVVLGYDYSYFIFYNHI
jgi:hypothetical protein